MEPRGSQWHHGRHERRAEVEGRRSCLTTPCFSSCHCQCGCWCFADGHLAGDAVTGCHKKVKESTRNHHDDRYHAGDDCYHTGGNQTYPSAQSVPSDGRCTSPAGTDDSLASQALRFGRRGRKQRLEEGQWSCRENRTMTPSLTSLWLPRGHRQPEWQRYSNVAIGCQWKHHRHDDDCRGGCCTMKSCALRVVGAR